MNPGLWKLFVLSLLLNSIPTALAAPTIKGPTSTAKVSPSSPLPPLDTLAIHDLYLEGDFDKATEILEKALVNKQLRHHGDSVFTFKHLGVMNAAKDNSREKGKYYMVQLLNLEPTAKILDMYASDMIYMIFKNIKDEFEESQKRLQRATAHVQENQNRSKTPAPAEPETKPIAKSKSNKHLYWIGGASAAIIGAGVAVYFLEKPLPAKSDIYNVD